MCCLFTEAIDWSGFTSYQTPVVDVFSLSCYSQNHVLATMELTYLKSGKQLLILKREHIMRADRTQYYCFVFFF